MTEGPPLPDRIRRRFTSLPAKQKSVARILADDPETVAMASVSEVARRAGVDAATVVRTCQNLGYSGWRELLADVRVNVTRQRTFAERVAELGGQDESIVNRIRDNALRNIDETFEGLDHESFDEVARVLSEAGLVLVAAGGVSTGVGEFLTSSLRTIGVRSALVTCVSDAAPALAPLGPGDVVLGISMWRYLRTTIHTLRHARQALGARTVAITDSAVSPAARVSDHTLVARTLSIGPSLSMTGVLALAEALVARIALLQPQRSRAAAAVASDLYFEGHVLAERETDSDVLDPVPRMRPVSEVRHD
ncbi:MAG TPA: MurR/RpiR family transcriptional regulator [Micromonosporaceae bacterium]